MYHINPGGRDWWVDRAKPEREAEVEISDVYDDVLNQPRLHVVCYFYECL